jgi:N-acetyl sugar amidotransferase
MAYQICKKTVMDTSDPGIRFDSEGISHHYHEFEAIVKSNWFPNDTGREILQSTIDEIKKQGKGKEFDCLLGLSGGVDSSFMLHKVVTEFGLRPLVFHVDGGWNSEIAVHNISTLIDKLGLDLYTEVINWDEMRNFQLAWFKAGVPHLDIPQDHAFIAVLYKFAEKYDIKYILNGGNISTECVLTPHKYFYWGTDMSQINDVLDRFGTIPMNTYPFSSVFRHKIYLRFIKGLRVIKPLNFMPYTKSSAIELLEKEYGWKTYPQKHFESVFTKFYESYWLPERFHFDVRRCQFSSLILTGQMTRDEALEELEKKPYNTETIHQEIEYIINKLAITSKEFNDFFTMPKKYYFDYKNQQFLLGMIEKGLKYFKLGRRGGAF